MSLILSPSLVLNALEADTAHLPLILWNNLVTAANVEASSEDADYPVVNITNPATTPLQSWRSAITTATTITVTLSAEIDCIGIARHNLSGMTVLVETLAPDLGAVLVEQIEVIPGTDAPLILLFEAHPVIEVQITITPADATEPEIAVLYVGKALRLERGTQPGNAPLPFARQRDIVNGWSESGEILGRIQSGGKLATKADINLMTPAFYRSDLDAFLAETPPFFWCEDPLGYPNEVGYVALTNDPVPTSAHLAGYVNVSLQMEGIAT